MEWIHFPRIRTFVEKRFHGLFSKKKRSKSGGFLRLNRFQEEHTVLAVVSLPIGQPTALDPYRSSRRLHSYFPYMLLHDSVKLYYPRHATSHRSIDRRGGTQRRLLVSSSWLLWHVACLEKCCVPPHRFCMFHEGHQRWLPASVYMSEEILFSWFVFFFNLRVFIKE